MALTSSKVNFSWTPQADGAFKKLKTLFASAPVLILPDHNKQFIVEVDASDTGVGAVYLKFLVLITRLTHVPFFLVDCPHRSKTMMWAIEKIDPGGVAALVGGCCTSLGGVDRS